jgi:hypothetical protein
LERQAGEFAVAAVNDGGKQKEQTPEHL